MIGLIAATSIESSVIQTHLSARSQTGQAHFPLFEGRIAGHPVSLIVSGVGKVNAALATETLLRTCHPQAVLLFGCGGAYPQSGLEVGDLAVATEEFFGDEGVQSPDGFLDMQRLGLPLLHRGDAPLFNRIPLPSATPDRIRTLLEPTLSGRGARLACGPFVTVSCGSGTDRLAADLATRTGGLCENMEGAAVAQVCLQSDIPLLELRGISNRTGDRNPAEWDIPRAVACAQQAVMTLLTAWEKVAPTQ